MVARFHSNAGDRMNEKDIHRVLARDYISDSWLVPFWQYLAYFSSKDHKNHETVLTETTWTKLGTRRLWIFFFFFGKMLKVDVYFQLWTRRTRKVQEKGNPRCTGPMPGQIAFDFLSSAKRVNNRESNIARGWSYSQQSNIYLKKDALYSLENPRILCSCQPLISKGSLADRDLDLPYGTRELWFLHQICRYYTVCRHVEAYTLGRLSIDGFSFERVAQSNLEWIFSNLDSGFQSLVGFRIPSAVFRIPKPRIPDSTSKKFLDSGIRIPLHGAMCLF